MLSAILLVKLAFHPHPVFLIPGLDHRDPYNQVIILRLSLEIPGFYPREGIIRIALEVMPADHFRMLKGIIIIKSGQFRLDEQRSKFTGVFPDDELVGIGKSIPLGIKVRIGNPGNQAPMLNFILIVHLIPIGIRVARVGDVLIFLPVSQAIAVIIQFCIGDEVIHTTVGLFP
ncbi:MAG: hypothetical protein A2V67_05080 [Deltaproteobacteria bacterium RBG_13_61_14]|nr:MAG: hypothetical protein A2V67_05080 [Deltaproteobacteria bacterium RBG_13_61_14]